MRAIPVCDRCIEGASLLKLRFSGSADGLFILPEETTKNACEKVIR